MPLDSWVRRLVPVLTVAVMLTAGLNAGRVSGWTPGGGSCNGGWRMISQQDDSFLWQETFLPFRSAAWTGTVQLWENWDSHCYVIDVRLIYTGTNAGGHLAVNGNVFVSFTVQYPNPFADYGNVAQDAYGDLTTWTPANDSAVQSRFNINDRGADEFLLQAPGGPFVLSEVTATFELPLQ